MSTESESPSVSEVIDLPQEDDAQVAADIARYVRHTPVGLEYDPDIPFEPWERTYKFYNAIGERTQWWLGDALRAGEKFGDRYLQAVHITGLSKSHLTTLVSVCGKFSDVRRRREELSFRCHAAVAYTSYQLADELLIRAIKEGLSSDNLRDEVKRIEAIRNGGLPPPPKKRGRQSKLLRAANVNEAKQSEVIDVAPATKLGLFWNGYQLCIRDRIVYGPEPMDDQEANKAAHHHGLAHSQALVNWLEQNGFIRKEGDEPCAQNTNESCSQTVLESTTAVSVSNVSASNGAAMSDPSLAPTPVPWAHELWKHLHDSHGLILLESEIDEILHLAEPLIPLRAPVCAPIQMAEYKLAEFLKVAALVDWSALQVLSAKRWLKLLHPIDLIINDLQDVTLKK